MAGSDASISVETRGHPLGLIVVPFKIGNLYTLNLVLNTGFPMSCLTPGARDVLIALGHLRPISDRLYQLDDIRIEEQPMSALDVRINTGVARLAVDGVVGLNFLGRFREVCFDVESRRLTLRS